MIDMLTQDERRSLFNLMVYIAKADGEICDKEQNFLEVYSKNLGVDWGGTPFEFELENILADFKDHRAKLIVIIELLRLAYMDGNYTENERKGIYCIATKMSISSEYLQKADAWVVKGLELAVEGTSLLAI